jgi:hypothetical protein
MFESVVILALAPFALATILLSVLIFLFIVVWSLNNMGIVIMWAVGIGLALAAVLLQFNPELAATIYGDLFR